MQDRRKSAKKSSPQIKLPQKQTKLGGRFLQQIDEFGAVFDFDDFVRATVEGD